MGRRNRSIFSVFEQREELAQQAKTLWGAFADRLMKLIPENLHSFATEKGWIKNKMYELDHWWPLPEWLQSLVTNTKSGGCTSDKYRENDLEIYGFESFDDLKKKFRELEQAWQGLVRIQVNDHAYGVEVCYYATDVSDELEGRNSIPTGPDPEVRDHGTMVFITNTITSPDMEAWVQKVAKMSGQRVDWYCAGGHVVRALGDMNKVMGAIMLLMSEHDELWRNAVKALNAGLEDMDPPRPAWWPC